MMKNDELVRAMRKEFFAFRNGIVADKLRNAGDPHPMIMGCLLADVVAIAGRACEDKEEDQLTQIAQELWNDTNSRECRLAAPMIYPANRMTLELALQWCNNVETVEIADNLCHKLLRHINDGDALFRRLVADERPLVKYTGYRLLNNLLMLRKVQPTPALKTIIETEQEHAQAPLTVLLLDILEEFEETEA